MTDDPDFEILSGESMRRKYGLTAAARPVVRLNPANVPADLHALIPLAEAFGVADDLTRADVLRTAPLDAVRAMRDAVAAAEDALTEWLAGPEADAPDPTPEYVAFSALIMAYDGA